MIMKEAMFYEKIEDKVRCKLCARNCNILEGEVGFCKVRKNIKGKLYSLVYDKIISTNSDPIEKKPLYHFHPGTKTFSISTIGCNWRCQYCCNWNISQESEINGEKLTPEDIVKLAKARGCKGISYTYTEPTVFFELSYDTAKLAHKKGLYNTWVTNGYTNQEPIKKISKYLDAVTVDFKGSGDKEFLLKYCSVPTPDPIYKALLEYKKNKIHIEITNLLIPKIGDSMDKFKQLVEWIKENLGEKTPLHIIRFFPTYKLKNLEPTSLDILKKAYNISKNLGMKTVHVGNVSEYEEHKIIGD